MLGSFCKFDIMKQHLYKLKITWTGNLGTGTSKYDAYSRDHVISAKGKIDLLGSADPVFRGDASKYNPEEMLLSALSTCHMLWYFHFCADHGIIVTAYEDNAEGLMEEALTGGGKFKEVVLKPIITITDPSKAELAIKLHEEANKKCFIANSVNFPVLHLPTIQF